MSIKEKLMHISPWSLILLLYLMFILSGLLMRLFGNFLSVIMFLMVVVIVAFAYALDTIDNVPENKTKPY